MQIVDKFNEIGNNFAISSTGIGEALQRSASALAAAGNSIDESVALITAANSVVQNPEQVGTALKTLSMRLRGTKTELEEAGEDTDGMANSVSQLQQKLLALSHNKVDIMADADTYKNSTEILREMADAWQYMTDVEKAAALELMGGKRQGNILASIIENFDIVEDVIEKSMDAEGSALKENEKYLDSIDGKTKQFTNSLQTMWMNAIDTNAVKGFIDFGTTLIRIFDQINKNNPIGIFGGLAVVGGTLYGAYKGLPKLFSSGISSLAKYVAGINGVKLATDGLTKSQYATQLATTILSDEQKEAALAALFGANADNTATIATDLKTKAEIRAALAATGLQGKELELAVSSVMAATGTNTLSASLGLLIKNIGAVTLAILKSPIFWIAAAIVAVIALVDALTVSFKEAKEQLKKTSEELESVQSEIESLNNELETTSKRIDELNSKDTLTIVEQDELDALNAQNAALEAQKELLEQREEILKNQQARDALTTFEKDQSFKSGLYNETDEQGYATGNVIEIDPEVDQLIARRKRNAEGLAEANEQLKIAQEELLKAQKEGTDTKSQQRAVDNAIKEAERYKKALETSENDLINLIKEREETYGDVGFFYGDDLTEDQKKWNEAFATIRADALKTYIALDNTGKAISSAFKEVASRQFFSDELKQIQGQVGITGEELAAMWENAPSEEDDPYGLKAFIQNLIDAGIIADTSVASMQKVVDLSIAMSKGSTEAERANKKLARSQKMLDYYNLAKDLHKYTNNVKSLTDAQKDEISIIKNKMSALAVEINAYDILGDKLAEVKQSFEDFENAQTADSNSDFTDDVSSMLQTIIEGYQSAEMGSEAFKSAFTSLIPESVYKDIDTLQGKYEAAAEYIRGTLSNYFKIEYNDDGLVNSIEVTTKNVQNFIEDAKAKGLMDFTDGVWTVNETDFKQFAKKMGITEEMLVAIGEQMDKIDADWITGDLTSFFDSFKMDAESEIYKNVRALAALDEQLIDGKINAEEYATKYKEYTDAIKESTNEAIDNINGYNEATKTVDALSEELSAAKDKLKELQDSGASEAEIKLASENVERVVKELDTALKLKDELGIPSQIELTFAQDSISAQYEALKAKWTNTTIELPVDLNVDPATNQLVKFDEEAGKYVISTELEGLSDEELGILQEYADLVNTQGTINLYMANYEQEAQKVEDLKTTAQETQDILENLDVKVEAKEAISTLNIIKSTLDSIKDKTVTITTINQTVETSVSKPASKNNRIGGNTKQAYAGGTNRVESNEHNALVGELGKELVVDPNTGSYYTVGDRGAEFIDLPKNAIVFNHKQTEEILKNGHINSRGKAYVNGKAFGGTSGTMYTGGAIESAFGGVVPGWFPKNSTLQNLGSSIDGASSSAEDDFEELFDWFEILTEEIEAQIDLMEAQLENSVGIDSKKSIYSGIISTEYAKMDAFTKGIALYTEQANKFLAQIPAQYKEMAKDGAIKITEFTGEANEKVVEAIKNYREWANKATDLNQQLEETKKRISDLRVETQNMISTEYDNKIGLITNLNDTLEAQIGLLEEKGERSSAKFYEEMAKNGDTQLKQLQQKRDAMQAELDSAVKSGDVTKYSDDWYEMVNAIYEVDKAVIDCETSIEGFNNSIQELHWENFEKIIDSITAVSDEAEQLRDLIDDTDITEASDPEKWSKDGVTALGLVAQQMENAQYRSKLYAKEIEYLKDEYKKGNYSQDEYNEKLRELKKNQWDAIDAYESAKDAIVDLNKTRVEAIKSGIQKEIDAYEKLINKRKEDLSAQQDAHEWANTVKDHTKNIDTIQRQIDAMEGDTSAAAAAQRKKLQEELAAAQEEYDEALYNRSIETQQQSLDKSLEVYRQEQETKMEELDAWLEKEEQVIAESYDVISANTEAIHSNIEAISDKYGIEIENNVVEPWTAGITALGTYETELDTATSRYVEMLGRVRQELVDIQLAADNTAASIINATNEASKKTESAVKDPPKPAPKPSKPSKPSYPGGYSGGYSSDFSNGQQVIVNSDATNFSRDGGNGGTKMHSWVPGSSFTVMETRGDEVLIGIPGQGYTGWVKKEDLTIKYAKGTTGVKNNQLAWIDENGLEEIVMHADNGRLTYLTKGSSVIPHDISENLMELGKVDPRTWMENNRKTTVPMNLTTNNNTIDLRFGSLINIEHADRDSIPEIQAAVQKQLDSYMKNINAGIKKYSR